MRKLICAVICAVTLLSLGLAFQGCGGSGHTSTEPTGPVARGNWIGTITGVHAGIHLNGTCPLEMNLDAAYNGQWWIDCPGASSRGEVLGLTSSNLLALTLTTTSPASSCPWVAINTATASTIDGTFHVQDCATHAEVSSGTLTLRRR